MRPCQEPGYRCHTGACVASRRGPLVPFAVASPRFPTVPVALGCVGVLGMNGLNSGAWLKSFGSVRVEMSRWPRSTESWARSAFSSPQMILHRPRYSTAPGAPLVLYSSCRAGPFLKKVLVVPTSAVA